MFREWLGRGKTLPDLAGGAWDTNGGDDDRLGRLGVSVLGEPAGAPSVNNSPATTKLIAPQPTDRDCALGVA